jgi:hypothetical protein
LAVISDSKSLVVQELASLYLKQQNLVEIVKLCDKSKFEELTYMLWTLAHLELNHQQKAKAEDIFKCIHSNSGEIIKKVRKPMAADD